jgi:hypothetical protein
MPVKFCWQALPSTGICHINCAEEDDGVSGWDSCPAGAKSRVRGPENSTAGCRARACGRLRQRHDCQRRLTGTRLYAPRLAALYSLGMNPPSAIGWVHQITPARGLSMCTPGRTAGPPAPSSSAASRAGGDARTLSAAPPRFARSDMSTLPARTFGV